MLLIWTSQRILSFGKELKKKGVDNTRGTSMGKKKRLVTSNC